MTTVETLGELDFLQKNELELYMDVRLYGDLFMALVYLSQMVLYVNYSPEDINHIYDEVKSRGYLGRIDNPYTWCDILKYLTKTTTKIITEDDLMGPVKKGAKVVYLSEVKCKLKNITVDYSITSYLASRENPNIITGFQLDNIAEYKEMNKTIFLVG